MVEDKFLGGLTMKKTIFVLTVLLFLSAPLHQYSVLIIVSVSTTQHQKSHRVLIRKQWSKTHLRYIPIRTISVLILVLGSVLQIFGALHFCI